MADTVHKLGTLALDIVENFVQSKLGEKFIKDLRAPTDEQIAITAAMQATADLLWTKWTDKRIWNAAFNHLPKKKELLQELKEAIKAFYEHPSDTHFAEVMKAILQEHEEFGQEIIQKSIDEYIAVLTREIALNDDAFREKVTALATLDSGDSLKSIAGFLANQKPPVLMPVYTQIPPHQETEDELQAALDLLRKLPTKRIPKPSPLPPNSRPPAFPPNPLFVGREDELRQLATWLKGSSPVAIGQIAAATGMGGIGKSQLAAEFAHRYGQFFAGGVFWLSFADPDLIPSEIAACGDPNDARPQDIRVRQILSDWQSPLPRLLVFDNCEDAHLLAHWRSPSGGSRLLVTSRQAAWDPALGVQTLALEVLPRPESLALLRGFRPDLAADDPDLSAIAAELGDLPLALHMAGKYLLTYQHDISPADYLQALRQPGLLKHRSLQAGEFSPTGHDLNVERTFNVSLQRLDKENATDQMALDLLQRVACFAPGELIPRDLLKASAGENIEAAAFADGLNRLLGLGLLEQNDAGDLRMHRLLARFILDAFPGQAALAKVEQAVSDASADADNSSFPARMLPLLAHLKFLTDQALKRKDEQAATLAIDLGYYLLMIADFASARPYLEQALAIRRKVLGEEHPNTATSLNNLGYLLSAMGDYASARPYYEQALAIRRKVLGEEHPATATSLNNLGSLLQAMGDYPAARLYYEQALAIRCKVLGEQHPDTATSLNNLGMLLKTTGDYAGARPNLEQALAILEKTLGPDHPSTRLVRENLEALKQQLAGQEK